MNNTKIKEVTGREILDSRGNPTVEATVVLADGSVGIGRAPSGASTGEFEALELRDNEKDRYHGKGVRKAVSHVNREIFERIQNIDAADLYAVDGAMLCLDKTKDKSRLGANAMLAVSIAAANAAAVSHKMPLFRFLGGIGGNRLPVPMMNIFNGGAHADNPIDVQEFMILPVGAESFREGVRMCAEVFHSLGGLLKEKGLSTGVGDEGGYAANVSDTKKVLEWILDSVERSGYRPGADVMLAIDGAASEWKGKKPGEYCLPKAGAKYTTDELIAYWTMLCDNYPIFSLEDPLDEEDWEGWRKLTLNIGKKVRLVGDDLFVTNTQRLKKGIKESCGNTILIKPNQIGTLWETIEAVHLAKENCYGAIASHRSGETEDTTIADLAVGLNMGLIKTGAPSRSERVAKYNRLLYIEELLGKGAVYMDHCIKELDL